MADIHLLGIKFIEQNTQDGLDFTYKPDVPKLKVIGTILIAAEEEEDEGCVYLTQKQLNQVLLNKDIELKLVDDTWTPAKPLNKDQIKKIGLVTIEAEYLGTAGEVRCYEAIKVSE
eukprot:TRINITY_DN80054_c0_g1_i1.p2 TRINITY_DN80054_c0_g1~~TRINITY_DN80054_c0_g1_i1.p2  ORF type:complete len:116 (+),score=26.21 TRINITY_DN80054_c0_g1_i1:692-1039(+)